MLVKLFGYPVGSYIFSSLCLPGFNDRTFPSSRPLVASLAQPRRSCKPLSRVEIVKEETIDRDYRLKRKILLTIKRWVSVSW